MTGLTRERIADAIGLALVLSDARTNEINRAADAVMALLSTPATTVLWEQETRPTDGDPTKSYIAPPLLDCPPGTPVAVVTRSGP